MNNKRGMLYLGTILLIFILFLVNAHAQIPDPETIKNDSVIKRVEQLRNFTEENKWDYLSQQWKVLFLKNPKGVRYASETLIPPFLNITKFLLNYYNVPPDR